jgi:hypothetical protein
LVELSKNISSAVKIVDGRKIAFLAQYVDKIPTYYASIKGNRGKRVGAEAFLPNYL